MVRDVFAATEFDNDLWSSPWLPAMLFPDYQPKHIIYFSKYYPVVMGQQDIFFRYLQIH